MHTLLRVIGVLPDQETSLQLRRRATRRIDSCVAVLRGAYAVRFLRARVHKSRMAQSRIGRRLIRGPDCAPLLEIVKGFVNETRCNCRDGPRRGVTTRTSSGL
jgi:hypothetical protein